MNGLKRNILVILILLVISTAAQANAGTSLTWATGAHLLIGNLFIGILEGTLLAKWYGIYKSKCIGIFILANYFSAWFGGFIILKISHKLPVDINNALSLFWLMVLVSYLFTLILEFPFAVFAFKGDADWLKKSIRGTFLIQTVSYIILFGWFGISSETSLFYKTKVVDPSVIQLPNNVQMYFISSNDGDIYTGSISNRKWQHLYNLNSSDFYDELMVRQSSENLNIWELVVQHPGIERTKTIDILIRKQILLNEIPKKQNESNSYYTSSNSSFGLVPTLGINGTSYWEFDTGYWGNKGLHGENSKTTDDVFLSIETPFIAWTVRNAVQLSNDTVLFQLGDNQICVYDPNTKQLALLAHGYGPIAVIKK
jgi:hypothetical protein